PPTFRHFARAGVLAAGRAVNDQDAGRLAWIVMLALSLPDRFMRGDPVFSQVVVRVGETRACLPGARGLAMVRIAVPCRPRDAIELGPQRFEGTVDVLGQEALAELSLVARELRSCPLNA
ncbi:MAG TPA: hypothetical protein VKA61_11855, partial [Sphingomicrobium sp.]|nr:hypothetical protein [Sphingomicrobium sp.]